VVSLNPGEVEVLIPRGGHAAEENFPDQAFAGDATDMRRLPEDSERSWIVGTDGDLHSTVF
jgi:hypothetical protein